MREYLGRGAAFPRVPRLAIPRGCCRSLSSLVQLFSPQPHRRRSGPPARTLLGGWTRTGRAARCAPVLHSRQISPRHSGRCQDRAGIAAPRRGERAASGEPRAPAALPGQDLAPSRGWPGTERGRGAPGNPGPRSSLLSPAVGAAGIAAGNRK